MSLETQNLLSELQQRDEIIEKAYQIISNLTEKVKKFENANDPKIKTFCSNRSKLEKPKSLKLISKQNLSNKGFLNEVSNSYEHEKKDLILSIENLTRENNVLKGKCRILSEEKEMLKVEKKDLELTIYEQNSKLQLMNKEWVTLGESFKKFQDSFMKTTIETNYIEITKKMSFLNEDVQKKEIRNILIEIGNIKTKVKEFVDDSLQYLNSINYNVLNDSLTILEKEEDTYIAKLEKRIVNLSAIIKDHQRGIINLKEVLDKCECQRNFILDLLVKILLQIKRGRAPPSKTKK